MSLGNRGPRLRIARPGGVNRRWYGRGADYSSYADHLAKERDRFASMPSVTIADRKRATFWLCILPAGTVVRRVDGHGKSVGKRFALPPPGPDDLPFKRTQVRRVNQQPEPLHSQASRMLKRAHRLSMLED